MKKWLKRMINSVLMGLAWAAVWAPVGVLIGTMIVDPDNSMDEMWAVVGAYPGFLCGAVFSAVLGIAEGRRRFDELSLSRVVAWGAVSGLLVGVLPFVLGTPSAEHPPWLLPVVVIGSVTLLSAVSAVGTALLAQMAKRRKLRDARADLA
jgi:O-antigen/teichoic acid export membrane protein